MDITLFFTLGALIFRWIEGKARLTPKFVADSPHCGKIRRFGSGYVEVCLNCSGIGTGHLNLVKLEVPHRLMPNENIRFFAPVPVANGLPVSIGGHSLSVGSIIILEGVLSSWIQMCSRLPQSHLLVKKFRYTWSPVSKSMEKPNYGTFKHDLVPPNLIWAVQVVELNNYGAIVSFNIDESEYANTNGMDENPETTEFEGEDEVSEENKNDQTVDDNNSDDSMLFLSYDEMKYIRVMNAHSSGDTGMMDSLCRLGTESIAMCESFNRSISGCTIKAHGRTWRVSKTESSNFDLFSKTATLKPHLNHEASGVEMVDDLDDVQVTLSTCKDLQFLSGRSALRPSLPESILDQMREKLREKYPTLKQFTLLPTGSHLQLDTTKVAVKWGVQIDGALYQLQSMHEDGLFFIRYVFKEPKNILSDAFLEYEDLENPIYELTPELPEDFNAAATQLSCLSASQSEREWRDRIFPRLNRGFSRPPVYLPDPIAVKAAPLIKPNNFQETEKPDADLVADTKTLGKKRRREEIQETSTSNPCKRQRTGGPEFESSSDEMAESSQDIVHSDSPCGVDMSQLSGNWENHGPVGIQYSPSGGVSGNFGGLGSSRFQSFAKAAAEVQKMVLLQKSKGQVDQDLLELLEVLKGLGQIESQCADSPPSEDPRPKSTPRNLFHNCHPSYYS